MNTKALKTRLLQLAIQNREEPGSLAVVMSDGGAEIRLKGVISADYGIGADDLHAGLRQADEAPIKLYINSPGGDVFEGREMQAMIAAYKGQVTAVGQGIVASAATLLTLAASRFEMSKGSRYMIHNGWTIAMGDRHAFKSTFDLLASFDSELAAEYAAKTGVTAVQASAWMDAETWFTAEQAVENKFAHAVNPNTQNAAMSAVWNLSAYANAPEQDDGAAQAEAAANQRRILQLNRSRLAALMQAI